MPNISKYGKIWDELQSTTSYIFHFLRAVIYQAHSIIYVMTNLE